MTPGIVLPSIAQVTVQEESLVAAKKFIDADGDWEIFKLLLVGEE